jgi:hypothetical protein
MVGDPAQIRALATRLRADAERLRLLAQRVGRTRDIAWRSPAADLFRERVGERVHSLLRSASELDGAAHRVDVHAEAVEEARAEMVRVARLGAGLAQAASDAATRAVGRR